METSEILARLALGSFCGAIIGLERERKEWAAGMRTHMLVALGSTLFMIVSMHGFSDVSGEENFSLDPSRVAAQVVSGIGFLGAGTIIFLRQGIVRGLTTASGLWTVAGIGLAIGAGMYIAGIASTVIALVILWVLQPVEALVYGRGRNKLLTLVLRNPKDSGRIIEQVMERLRVKSISMEENENGETCLLFRSNQSAEMKKITQLMTQLPEIKRLNLEDY